MNLDAVNHGDSLKADLHRKVLQEQLKILQKQLEVLDVQKEVYLLQKEELLAELNEYKSMEDLWLSLLRVHQIKITVFLRFHI